MMDDRFVSDLACLPPRQRLAVMVEASALLMRLQEQIGSLITATMTKAPKWTPEMIAKLRCAYAKYGDDEDVARALSITRKAAERARLRYIGRQQRSSMALVPSALRREPAWEPSGRPISVDATSPSVHIAGRPCGVLWGPPRQLGSVGRDLAIVR